MRRLGLLLVFASSLALGQALSNVLTWHSLYNCAWADPQLCSSGPLLSILPNGPTSAQQAAGSLIAATGQTITDTRASSVYCTNSSGVLVLLSNNQPCVEAAGLRAEGSATNLSLQSNVFSNAAWTLANVTVAQNVTGPDGVANSAWTVTDNATAGAHRLFALVSTASGAGTTTLYAKAGSVNFVGLSGVSNGSVWNVSTCAVATQGTGDTASAVSLGNGWCRLVLNTTYTGVTNQIVTMGDTAAHALGPNNSYAGGSNTVLIWGSQVEQQAFASSYIPTTTASVTRAADSINLTNPLPSPANQCYAVTIAGSEASPWAPSNLIVAGGTFSPNGLGFLNDSQFNENQLNVWNSTSTESSTSPGTTPGIAVGDRMAGCVLNGAMTAWRNGTVVGTATMTGSFTALPATLFIGNGFNGWLKNICADTAYANCH